MAAPRSCGNHRPYPRRADAQYALSWHLACWKCRAGWMTNVFLCTRTGKHFHWGHKRPKDQG